MPNPIEHLEIKSKNLDESEKFFTDVFGWKFERAMPTYTVFKSAEGKLGGGFAENGGAPGQPVISFITVEDIPTALATIEANGGATVLGKTEISPEWGYYATFTDPHGVSWGLWSQK